MILDQRIRFVFFAALISAGVCRSENGAGQKQNRQVNHQTNPTHQTTNSSAGRIAAILVAKPRQVAAPKSPSSQLQPEASNSRPKSADSKHAASKLKGQLGKRQVDLSLSPEVNKPTRRNEDAWFLDQAPLPLQPYRFNYNVKDKNGLTEQYRQEAGDGKFLTGSYGYVLPDGIFRHVDYVADDRGFRAFIRTSEPGTANQNPADVVINSSPVPGAGGYHSASISSATAANSADQIQPTQLNLFGPAETAQRLPPVLAPGGTKWAGDNLGLWNYSNFASPIGVDRLKLGSLDSSLPRRPPGSIVGTPLRNFTSFAYAPVLSTDGAGQQSRDSNSALGVGNFQSLSPFADFGRLRPIGGAASGGNLSTGALGDGERASSAQPAADNQRDQIGPNQDRDLLNPVINHDLYQQRPGLFLPSRVGPDVLLYDRPFGLPAGLPSVDSHKLAYDYNNVLAGDSSAAGLQAAEERLRGLAHLDRLRTLSRIGNANVLELAPKELGQSYGSAPTSASGPAGQQATSGTGSTKTTTSSSHHSEHRHEHKSMSSSNQLVVDDANRSSVTREQGSGLSWGSGHDSSSSSRQTAGGELAALTTPPLLQPPPQPQFSQQGRSWAGQQAKGQSARLFAPYAEERHFGVKGAGLQQEAPSSQQLIDEAHQQRQPTTTTASGSMSSPAPPPPPPPPPSPSPPQEPSRPATPDDRSAMSSTTRAATPEELEHTATPKAHQTVRSVRMPDDWRTSMMMSDLRHMQNAFGLPQPPRLQRSSPPSPSTGANLAEQLVLARMARVDSLLGDLPNRRQSPGAAQQQASVQQAVAVPANKARTGNTLPEALLASQPTDSNALEDDQPRRATSQKAKALINQQQQQQQLADSSRLEPNRNQSSESLFEAQRLGAIRAKLRSDKVSELEKFQQRLKTQQLLLEQVKNNESKLSSKQKVASANAQANEANSHVKYDDNQDNELPTRPDDRDQEQASRARRQNEVKPGGETGRTRSSERDFARQLQQWPSLAAGARRNTAEPNNSSEAVAQNSLTAHKMENVPSKSDSSSQAEAQKRAGKPAEVNATLRAGSPNTINLDFINSVTALSMDQLNPFAMSSVNPAIQRSAATANSERLLPHRLDLPLIGSGGHWQQAQTGGGGSGSGGGANLSATAPAKYFNPAELVAALDHHGRHDAGQRMRNLLSLNQPTNHQQADGLTSQTSQSLNQLLASHAATATAAPEQAAVSRRSLDSLLGAKLIVAPASSSLMSAAADSQHKSVMVPLARVAPAGSLSDKSSGSSQAVSASYRRDGFEIRDRSSQADNHRFYEVVSSARRPDELSSSFLAFRGELECDQLASCFGQWLESLSEPLPTNSKQELTPNSSDAQLSVTASS